MHGRVKSARYLGKIALFLERFFLQSAHLEQHRLWDGPYNDCCKTVWKVPGCAGGISMLIAVDRNSNVYICTATLSERLTNQF